MLTHRLTVLAVTLLATCQASVVGARYPDRWYRFGDDPSQGTSAGPVENSGNGQTYDSVGAVGVGNLQDLTPSGSPGYVNIAVDRPVPAHTANNWAIQFDGVDDYLLGDNLNIPSESIAAFNGENYAGITNRGYQLWVKPGVQATGGPRVVIDDGEEYEMRINAAGKWSPESRDDTVATSVSPTVNTWTHIAQVRPKGDTGGSITWIDGIARASQTGTQRSSLTTGLVIGANAATDNAGGTAIPAATTYFSGIVDEIEMFVLGGTYGEFDYTRDNGYFTDIYLPAHSSVYSFVDLTGPRGAADGHNDKLWVQGDITFDGVRNQADITAFIAGWLSTNAGAVVGAGPRVGDYTTLAKGDFDLDGDTDVNDFGRLRAIFNGTAVVLPTEADLLGLAVPEPAALLAAGGLLLGALGTRRRLV